jgi:hypothetical protein
MRRACLIVLLVLCALPAGARASATQESMFQDDDQLEFASADHVTATLDTLRSLGVDRIRVSVFWKSVAPSPAKQAKPDGFDGSNPDAYPKGAWDRYDLLAREAQARGIAVAFDVTGPAPMWATGNPDRKDIDETYTPDPAEFGAFVRAVGTRYSGQFTPAPPTATPPPSGDDCPVPNVPPLPPGCSSKPPPPPPAQASSGPLPRVDYWEVWNEPNQAGWLTPQWLPRPGGKSQFPMSPVVYRGLADAMYSALQATGHGSDTIIVGATAPKGLNVKGVTRSIKPLQFIRELYCVDSHLQILQGASAQIRGCPQSDQVAQFPAAHPVLFHMTGWAHHPYELTFPPNRRPTDPNYVTIANLSSLSDTLRRVYARYAQAQPPGGLPLYLTEFGYQTNPPDRFGVSASRQASYLDEAEYMAWRNPLVRTLSQFLLVDGGDPVGLTFQSGLEWIDGRKKPSYRAYRLPIWMPRRHARRGTRVRVWGLVRPAANGTAPVAQVQFRRARTRDWHVLATKHGTAARGYVNVRVRLPGRGSVRLVSSGMVSRSVSVG